MLLTVTFKPTSGERGMYYDLFLPFPQAEDVSLGSKKKGKDKGKAKALVQEEKKTKSCWEGIDSREGKKWSRDCALAAHCESHLITPSWAFSADATDPGIH